MPGMAEGGSARSAGAARVRRLSGAPGTHWRSGARQSGARLNGQGGGSDHECLEHRQREAQHCPHRNPRGACCSREWLQAAAQWLVAGPHGVGSPVAMGPARTRAHDEQKDEGSMSALKCGSGRAGAGAEVITNPVETQAWLTDIQQYRRQGLSSNSHYFWVNAIKLF